jgi:lipopolysaccharide export system permease protein
MNKIYQRYLGSSFILPIVTTVVFFVMFLLTFELLKITNLVFSKDLSLAYTLKFFGFIGVTFLPMALPLSVLFASIYTFNKINSDSEFVALRSLGLSKFKIILPFLTVAFVISVVTFVLNQTIIPYASVEFKKGLKRLHASSLITEIQPRQFFLEIPNVTLFADKINKETKYLENVFINFSQKRGQNSKTITATRGKFIQSINKEKNENRIRLKLEDGVIVTYKDDKIDKLFFKKYDFPLSETILRKNISMKPSMLTGRQLIDVLNMNEVELKKIRYNKRDVTSAELEFWTRFNTALQCLLFVLVGFNFGIKNNRGDSNTGLRNFSTLLLYYGLYFWGLSLARKGVCPSYMAVFLPSILLFILSYKNYKKLDWFG